MTQPPYARPPAPAPRQPWGVGRILLVCFGVMVLLLGAAVAVVLALGPLIPAAEQVERDAGGRVTSAATVDKDDLRAGDCVNDTDLLELEPGGDLDDRRATVEVVPCADLHDFEVSATFTLPDADYPEAADLRQSADRECVRLLRREWPGDGRLLRDKLLAYYLPPLTGPQEDQVVCLLQLASGERMRGTIR